MPMSKDMSYDIPMAISQGVVGSDRPDVSRILLTPEAPTAPNVPGANERSVPKGMGPVGVPREMRRRPAKIQVLTSVSFVTRLDTSVRTARLHVRATTRNQRPTTLSREKLGVGRCGLTLTDSSNERHIHSTYLHYGTDSVLCRSDED